MSNMFCFTETHLKHKPKYDVTDFSDNWTSVFKHGLALSYNSENIDLVDEFQMILICIKGKLISVLTLKVEYCTVLCYKLKVGLCMVVHRVRCTLKVERSMVHGAY